MRIYWVAASKSVSTWINLYGFTAQHYSVAWKLLPSYYCVIWEYVWKLWYLKVDSAWGSVPDLTKYFAFWFCICIFLTKTFQGTLNISVSITLITGGLLPVFLRNVSFLSWNSMSKSIYGCYQLWLDYLGSHQKQHQYSEKLK